MQLYNLFYFHTPNCKGIKPNYIFTYRIEITHKVKPHETKKLLISLKALAFVTHVKAGPTKHNKNSYTAARAYI